MCIRHIDLDSLVFLVLSGTYILSVSSSLSPEWKELMEATFGLSVPRFLALYIMSSCGFLYCSHLLQDETYLMMAKQGIHSLMSIAECH